MARIKPNSMPKRSVAKPGFFLNTSVIKKMVDPVIGALTKGQQHRACETFNKARASWTNNPKSDCYLYARWILGEVHMLVGTHHKWFTTEDTKTINEATRELIRLLQA